MRLPTNLSFAASVLALFAGPAQAAIPAGERTVLFDIDKTNGSGAVAPIHGEQRERTRE